MTHFRMTAIVASVLLAVSAAPGDDVLRLADFESADDVKLWEFPAGAAKLVDQNVGHGQHALEITFDPKHGSQPAYMSSYRLRKDWSGYDALQLTVFNPNDEPIPGYVLIADAAWEKGGRSYWNRHNGSTMFAPGKSTWTIALGGLYRGEAGSRNNDIKRGIDINSIVRIDFGFGHKGANGRVIIDDLRLVKATRPAGVWAFDFGPPDQSVMLGWTAASNKSAYDKKEGSGWIGGTPWQGAARDTTFGPALIRDFCEAGGYRFRIDVPAGKYRVTIIYENCGYWGGEQATHSKRRVLVDDREVYAESRPDGPAHSLYRFEDVEPIGVDVWDTYMKPEIARAAGFDVQAGKDGLTLKFESDRPFGSRLAALAVHRADDTDAAKWVEGQLDAVRDEFRATAVCLDRPAPAWQLPEAWAKHRFVAWPVTLEQDINPSTLPPADVARPDKITLAAQAVQGEIVTLSLAIRPAADLGQCSVYFADLVRDQRSGEVVSAKDVTKSIDVGMFWYGAQRGFNSIAYHVRPVTLRPVKKVNLVKDVTRQFVVKVAGASGKWDTLGAINVIPESGGTPLVVPVKVKVSRVVLDRATEFRMGFFGLMPPGMLPADRQQPALEQTLAMLREAGMNMVCGGPNWKLTGWRNGEPIIDFAEADAFFALLARHGFDGPINGYGGLHFAGLHDGYFKGAAGDKAERDSGLKFEEALMRAWSAVDKHAREKHWPTIWYAMCDETRVRGDAENELAFMKQMAKVTAAFPKTVRASGSYSVGFAKRPTDPNDMLYWEQRFFETLDISDLNTHDAGVLAEAKKLGKDVHIYNQGTSRYSFGLYQWCEARQGVKARTQWHLNVLHGYQFFDLDGREPDTAMICYGRSAIYPTLAFERCREGAQDFYLYNTLARAIDAARAAGKKDAAADAAAALLAEIDVMVKLNQRQPPDGFDAEKLKTRVIAAIEAVNAIGAKSPGGP